jgi:hypothetical protein
LALVFGLITISAIQDDQRANELASARACDSQVGGHCRPQQALNPDMAGVISRAAFIAQTSGRKLERTG